MYKIYKTGSIHLHPRIQCFLTMTQTIRFVLRYCIDTVDSIDSPSSTCSVYRLGVLNLSPDRDPRREIGSL